MCFEEVDEISDEDLEASSEFYDRLVSGNHPCQQARRIALEQFNISLPDNVLNHIIGMYACTLSSMDDCVRACLTKAGLLHSTNVE